MLRDSSFPYPKDYMLQDYLAALEQFLEEQQARGMPLEKITCFSTPSLGRAKDVQEKFKQLAREGKSRVSKKDGHYMSVCVRLVREEKLLAQPPKVVDATNRWAERWKCETGHKGPLFMNA